jgi:hypothetical protein
MVASFSEIKDWKISRLLKAVESFRAIRHVRMAFISNVSKNICASIIRVDSETTDFSGQAFLFEGWREIHFLADR